MAERTCDQEIVSYKQCLNCGKRSGEVWQGSEAP